MRSKYLFQLAMIVVLAITIMAFFEKTHSKKQCGSAKNCCNKNCKGNKQATDNSDNIFYNPVNTLIAAVYK